MECGRTHIRSLASILFIKSELRCKRFAPLDNPQLFKSILQTETVTKYQCTNQTQSLTQYSFSSSTMSVQANAVFLIMNFFGTLVCETKISHHLKIINTYFQQGNSAIFIKKGELLNVMVQMIYM